MLKSNMKYANSCLASVSSVHLFTGYRDATVPLHRYTHHAYQIYLSHFLLVWLLFLVLVMVGGWLLSGSTGPAHLSFSRQDAAGVKTESSWRFSLSDGLAAIMFLLFVVCYIAMIFYKEDFAYYDDDMLTDFSLQGKNFTPPIWPASGRFYPLADQEFNVLGHITRSSVGYHALVAMQLVVLLAVLFVVLREFKIRYRAGLLIAVMAAPSFVIPFAGFVYPERNVLFWLAIMLLCLLGYSRTKARVYFVGCLIAAHFALYYKETVVLFVVAFAVSRLLLRLYVGRKAGHRSWQELARENSLSLGVLAVAGIYVALFLAAVLPNWKPTYLVEHREALHSVLLAYLQIDWMPMILLTVFIVRFGRFTFSGGELDPMWDPLAVGAIAYFLGILGLRLNTGYYMAPADFISLLYLARMSLVWLSKPTKARVSVVAILFTCVLLHDVAYSSFRIIERKNTIAAKSQLADFLKGYLPTVTGRTVELFFPYARGFNLMELSSYLRYRGFPLDGPGFTGTAVGPRLVIKGREEFINNKCVEYRDYACIHAESASPGALIVILPDDRASMDDVENVGKNTTLLLNLKSPDICTRKDSWFRKLHGISAEFSLSGLPEHWLQLHVFKN